MLRAFVRFAPLCVLPLLAACNGEGSATEAETTLSASTNAGDFAFRLASDTAGASLAATRIEAATFEAASGRIVLAHPAALSISDDGGQTFRQVAPAPFPNAALRAAYAYGDRLLVLTDRGRLLTTELDGRVIADRELPSSLYSSRFVVAGSRIFAKTSDGVLRSEDGGATFQVDERLANATEVYANGNVVVGQTYDGLLISTDGGQTFRTKEGARHRVAVTPSAVWTLEGPFEGSGSFSRIALDEALTTTTHPLGFNPRASYDSLSTLAAFGEHVVITSEKGFELSPLVLVSDDGGATLRELTFAEPLTKNQRDVRWLELTTLVHRTGFALVVRNPERESAHIDTIHTAAHGATAALGARGAAHPFNRAGAVAMAGANGVIYAGNKKTLFVSEPASLAQRSWRPLALPQGSFRSPIDVDALVAGAGVVAAYSGPDLYASRNRGQAWSRVKGEFAAKFSASGSMVVECGGNTPFLTIFGSGSDTSTQVIAPSVGVRYQCLATSHGIYISAENGLARSTDEGQTWTTTPWKDVVQPDDLRFLYKPELAASDDAVLLRTASAIYVTHDGERWGRAGNLERATLVGGARGVLVAWQAAERFRSQDVVISRDDGKTWTALGLGRLYAAPEPRNHQVTVSAGVLCVSPSSQYGAAPTYCTTLE
jgi:photosystem II stability/assembly factor-like uncharacterized protein